MNETSWVSYREVLKKEFQDRSQKNSLYSLTAFARDLRISVSHLSGILSGQESLSVARARSIANGLGYHRDKVRWFNALVAAEHARTTEQRERAQKDAARLFKGVQTSWIERVIEFPLRWYHLAIRRLGRMGPQNRVSVEAAQNLLRFGLTESELKSAFQNLVDSGMADHGASATEILIKENVSIPKNKVSESNRKRFYSECLALLRTSYEDQAASRKNATSPDKHNVHVFSIPKGRLAELDLLIREFEEAVDALTYTESETEMELQMLVIGRISLLRSDSSGSRSG